VKSTYYDQATIAYNAQDYPQALKGYYQCLKEDWNSFEPGDAGLLYHRIGNCLIKMRQFKEAAASYQKALQDENYNEKTSIHVNLATTLNGIGKYPEAISYFNKALSDEYYPTPYRAYMGLGTAYTKLGRFIEAGTAYRCAALDESNPNPVKALLNLGETFSSLGRPNDAIEAYLAVLDFKVTGASLNTTLERLGQAYVAAGRYKDALDTFEDVLSQERFSLSQEAYDDYQKARVALGYGDKRASASRYDSTAKGLDKQGSGSFSQYPSINLNESDGYGAGNIPNLNDSGFFTATDAELMETGKRQLRRERKLRHTGLKIILTIVIILILALGTCVVAYMQGFGIPSQEKVIKDFFAAYAAGEPVDKFWLVESDKDNATVAKWLEAVPKSSNVIVVGLESDMKSSLAVVDLKLKEGGVIHYRINMARDLISWKITGIELVFASDK